MESTSVIGQESTSHCSNDCKDMVSYIYIYIVCPFKVLLLQKFHKAMTLCTFAALWGQVSEAVAPSCLFQVFFWLFKLYRSHFSERRSPKSI